MTAFWEVPDRPDAWELDPDDWDPREFTGEVLPPDERSNT